MELGKAVAARRRRTVEAGPQQHAGKNGGFETQGARLAGELGVVILRDAERDEPWLVDTHTGKYITQGAQRIPSWHGPRPQPSPRP